MVYNDAMAKRRMTSRLQKIEDRKNQQQAILFGLLTIGFLLLLIFVGFPLFIKASVLLGDMRSGTGQDKNDTIPPVPPRIIANVEATQSATISLRGYAEPGSAVTLYTNTDKGTEVVTDKDGNFIFSDIKLMGGENHFYAVAKDSAGNESQPSGRLTIAFDNEAPEITLSSPEDGSRYFDEEREVLVSGQTDPDANVRVNDYVVVVDTEGNFVKRLQLLTGENEITVVAKDKAGNESKETLIVHYSR